jgi:hypothetical protein
VGDLRELLEDVADPATFTIDAQALVGRGRARRRRRAAALTAGSACLAAILLVTTVDALDDPEAPAQVDTGPATTVADTTTTSAAPTTTAPAPTTTTPVLELGPLADLGLTLQPVDLPARGPVGFTLDYSGVFVVGGSSVGGGGTVLARVEDLGAHTPIELPGDAEQLAVGRFVWVGGADGIVRVEPDTAEITPLDLGELPGPTAARAVATTDAATWAIVDGPSGDVLLGIDDATSSVLTSTPLDGFGTDLVVASDGAAWVRVETSGPAHVERRGPDGTVSATIERDLVPVAAFGADVWLAGTGTLVRIDPDGTVLHEVDVPGILPTASLGAADLASILWVATEDGIELLDPATGAWYASIPWPDAWSGPAQSIVTSAEGVWVSDGAGHGLRYPGADPRLLALAGAVDGLMVHETSSVRTGSDGEASARATASWRGRRVVIGIDDGTTIEEAMAPLPADHLGTRTASTIAGVPVVVDETSGSVQWSWQTDDRQMVRVVEQARTPDAPPLDVPTEVLVELLIRATVPGATVPGATG